VHPGAEAIGLAVVRRSTPPTTTQTQPRAVPQPAKPAGQPRENEVLPSTAETFAPAPLQRSTGGCGLRRSGTSTAAITPGRAIWRAESRSEASSFVSSCSRNKPARGAAGAERGSEIPSVAAASAPLLPSDRITLGLRVGGRQFFQGLAQHFRRAGGVGFAGGDFRRGGLFQRPAFALVQLGAVPGDRD